MEVIEVTELVDFDGVGVTVASVGVVSVSVVLGTGAVDVT